MGHTPTPRTPHPAPCTLHPAPCTLRLVYMPLWQPPLSMRCPDMALSEDTMQLQFVDALFCREDCNRWKAGLHIA